MYTKSTTTKTTAKTKRRGKAPETETVKAPETETVKAPETETKTNGGDTFRGGNIAYKVSGDTLPTYNYIALENVVHGKRVIKTGVYKTEYNGKSVYIAENFDTFLERLPTKAAYKNAVTKTATAKGSGNNTFRGETNYIARSKEHGGYSSGETIPLEKYKELTATLLVYCRSVYIETESDIYIYILRNKGTLEYTEIAGFKVG